ncbi:MAG TPA: winged helix-turn-helix domain-containing protein [Ramlibacter sp.]|nr:winged helix-turn-helix domain-containing protein [Ramlibacter sp.]
MARYRDFEIRQDERLLLVGGAPAPIGARAFDLLVALAERADRVVAKGELLDVVWPHLVVEENNLQVQIHGLRKLLGPGAITTVPGRGYRFTAEPAAAQRVARPARTESRDDETLPGRLRTGGNLPEHVPPLYGREDALSALDEMLPQARLVTITGASGIGKTRLAQALAHQRRGAFAGGTWMVELASVQQPDQVPAAVAQALGVQLAGRGAALDELAAALGQEAMLVVLDNCEHLVESVGRVAWRLLADCPGLRLLATSQELLRVAEEKVYKLAPLAVPEEDAAADPSRYGAVRLFVERAQALDRCFELDARNAGRVIDICRKLDGIPLAIELAAARVPSLGVYALHERLGERFRMLTGGARVSLRRHQTLRAALDWSHNLLSEEECKVFRRLAVFSDGFCIEGAQLACADATIDAWQVLDVLNALVDKSLVLVDAAARPRYRFLESTRAYAMEKLAEAGETTAWLQRHAEAVKAICDLATRQRDAEWMWAEMNNVRVAYAWATGPGAHPLLAVSLATSSAMVLAVSGLVHEAMQRLQQVEPLVDAGVPPELAARFWQWLGRGGMEGRLPTSRCLEALARAEEMFRRMGNQRHVHACLRMRAEAMVAAHDLTGADAALREAEAMEVDGWPVADQLRRLRVTAMLEAASGQPDAALARFERAQHMAHAHRIHRYETILLADMARLDLEAGRYAEAAERFRVLAGRADLHPSQGLTRAQAWAGLVAGLTGQRRLEEATAACTTALPLLRRCGILLAHCDVLAWLACLRGQHAAAARLAGAADGFHRHSEMSRDAIRQHARNQVQQQLDAGSARALEAWSREASALDEGAIAEVVLAMVEAPARAAWGRVDLPLPLQAKVRP